MNYDDLLLPRLSGADVRVYGSLRIIESAKGKVFSVYRRTINKICGVDRRFISKAMVRLKRMGIIEYELKKEKQTDKRGRFIKGSYKTRYININILLDVFSINRQTLSVQRSTVNRQTLSVKRSTVRHSMSDGPSDTECQLYHRQTGSESPSSKEEVAERPASAFGEAVGKAVPAVEKKKELTEDQKEREDIENFMSGLHAREVATPLPPHVGVATQPPPPVEIKQKFSKIDSKNIPVELSDLLTRIKTSHVA